MRVSLPIKRKRILAHSAVILLGGLAAGCSSSAMRFGDITDGLFTGSTANQRQIIQDQPYPGDQSPNSVANREAVQPVDVSRGSVSRGALPPVASPRAAPPAAQNAVARAQTAVEQAPVAVTPRAVAAAPAVEDTIKGWSRAGGTQVTAKDGETVYNLSRRFGVPADIIMKMNGISAENGLKTGQTVVIPTYVYSAKAGISAPDNDPKTAEAKSSRGVKPTDAPKPAEQRENVAVLPNAPKVREVSTTPTASADAAQPKAAPAGGSYTVVEGDSLSKISRKTGVGVTALKEANGLKNGNIRIGQVLRLDGKAAVAAASPAAVDNAAKTASISPAEKNGGTVAGYTPPKKAIEQAEQESSDAAPDATGIGRMRWPVRGRVVSGYGSSGGSKNDGIDIAVPKGTPVKAAENGVVIYAGDGLKEFGNTVLVRHENGLVTVYGHASELKVQRGQKVKRGDEIAVSGMSGNAATPKLHFEVRKNSAPVDPKTFLE
ncbi:peptidoglycan DD-metalloendopeptidase family protein [Arvimicrobium flavum]|uniref:peptidoglycan DD-metalloendopeptidase family protein n=1 Tax=Arvimicrobium flavum TaxID=3393320 RepID=UPI00237AB861|nr:peptidoglycan DD-metalloendopeptidase family protein [Mesorhizobium shangrilense]